MIEVVFGVVVRVSGDVGIVGGALVGQLCLHS